MKVLQRATSRIICLVIISFLATNAFGAGPIATPDRAERTLHSSRPTNNNKAFGDPTDLKAAAIAAADYVRYMQADITEDNAGNGNPDQDLEDGGWHWVGSAFEHDAGASPANLYGVTANGMLQVYAFNPDPALFTAMQDAADFMVTAGPAAIRSASDINFLMDFAALPGVGTPGVYESGAEAIWLYRLANYGIGTATSFAEYIRDFRGISNGYQNGIIPWDIASYATGVMKLEAAFPGNGYAAQAAEIAEVLYQDSFALAPGFFDFATRCKGSDPAYADTDFYWYALGIGGLIEAFQVTGTHLAEIPALEILLLECQYSDGAFGFQYGAPAGFDDRDWQSTAYSALAIDNFLTATPTNTASLQNSGIWLASTQGLSGGFVYTGGDHYPEIGAECAAALAAAYDASAASITAFTTFNDPAMCGDVGEVSFYYDRSDATPGLYGYELILDINGGLVPTVIGDFFAVEPMDFFRVDANLDGTFTVNGTHFGAHPGTLIDAELFVINMVTDAEVDVTVDVVSYRLRDPQNVPIFADMVGVGFAVDCTAPVAVTNITADPRHNKVDVAWTHDGIDTIVYEVYRGLWYDTAVGVSAYPEYDDLVGNTLPTRPVDRNAAVASPEWEYAGAVPVGTLDFTDVWPDATSRGVYYYEVFAVDAAVNTSVAAPANDRATNYWLGDVSAIDGMVGVDDITALGTAFATVDGDVGYNNAVDVGPTDDWSALGIPTTDDLIDFEDLIVFAINFSVVTPAKTQAMISDRVDLAWLQREDGRWALHLVNGTGVQAIHVRSTSAINRVESGSLLLSQGATPFLVNPGSTLDVNLALLGRGAAFVGQGELFVVDSVQDIAAKSLAIDVRGVDNSKINHTLDNSSSSLTPLIFELKNNHPNPFNPRTTISFSLPEPQPVNLTIYSLDGRRVATLLRETRGPGNHDVIWQGQDDSGHAVASGTYFYRLDAGPYSQVRKMVLMK